MIHWASNLDEIKTRCEKMLKSSPEWLTPEKQEIIQEFLKIQNNPND
jgi:hypothetical protein